jgi:nucleoside 2-deoxyribosyltransferase
MEFTPTMWRDALNHGPAQAAFASDKVALDRCDCGILVLPSGRSAHLEAGYLAGKGVPVLTFAEMSIEPELMQLLLGPPERICTSIAELFQRLGCEDALE